MKRLFRVIAAGVLVAAGSLVFTAAPAAANPFELPLVIYCPVAATQAGQWHPIYYFNSEGDTFLKDPLTGEPMTKIVDCPPYDG